MAFNFLSNTGLSAVAIAVSALVTGCGGGGGAETETSQAAMVSSDTTVTAAAGKATQDTPGMTSAVSQDGTLGLAPSVGASTAPSTSNDSTTLASADTAVIAAAASPATPVSTIATTQGTGGAASSRSGVGMNVSPLDTGSPEIPSIDLMKRAGSWYVGCSASNSTQCSGFAAGASGFNTLEAAKLDLDSQGWIRSLPAKDDTTVKFRTASTVLSAGIAPDGEYVVRYDGAGTITYQGVATKVTAESAPGRDVVKVTNSASGGFFLTINATDKNNYLRNIRVYPPGGACSNDYTTFAADASACTGAKGTFVAFESFPSTHQWYPQFITDLTGFRTLRFMDWGRANTSTLANWADRPQATDRTWNGPYGVPVEKQVDLANDAGADPWINLPLHATDDYVHQFAKLVHSRMATTRTLNLEYANETWNYGLQSAAYLYNQAAAAWPAEVAKKTSIYSLQLSYYAQRTVQMCDIVKAEFGADANRVRCIANTQMGPAGAQILACPYAAPGLGKQCAKSIDVIAVAPYFGAYISNPKLRTTVNGWYGDSDGGLGKMFQELTGLDASGNALAAAPLATSGSGAPLGAIAYTKMLALQAKTAADSFGKPLWAYEGGQHLVSGDSDMTYVNFEIATNRDARMGAAYAQAFADWKALGAQTFVYYAHVGTPSKYGMWGLKEKLTDTNNPKWQAVMKARNAACWWAGC